MHKKTGEKSPIFLPLRKIHRNSYLVPSRGLRPQSQYNGDVIANSRSERGDLYDSRNCGIASAFSLAMTRRICFPLQPRSDILQVNESFSN